GIGAPGPGGRQSRSTQHVPAGRAIHRGYEQQGARVHAASQRPVHRRRPDLSGELGRRAPKRMSMYMLQRLVGALSVLFVVSVVSFGLYALTPGDPAVVLLESSGLHSPPADAVAAKRAELHLDDA